MKEKKMGGKRLNTTRHIDKLWRVPPEHLNNNDAWPSQANKKTSVSFISNLDLYYVCCPNEVKKVWFVWQLKIYGQRLVTCDTAEFWDGPLSSSKYTLSFCIQNYKMTPHDGIYDDILYQKTTSFSKKDQLILKPSHWMVWKVPFDAQPQIRTTNEMKGKCDSDCKYRWTIVRGCWTVRLRLYELLAGTCQIYGLTSPKWTRWPDNEVRGRVKNRVADRKSRFKHTIGASTT